MVPISDHFRYFHWCYSSGHITWIKCGIVTRQFSQPLTTYSDLRWVTSGPYAELIGSIAHFCRSCLRSVMTCRPFRGDMLLLSISSSQFLATGVWRLGALWDPRSQRRVSRDDWCDPCRTLLTETATIGHFWCKKKFFRKGPFLLLFRTCNYWHFHSIPNACTVL